MRSGSFGGPRDPFHGGGRGCFKNSYVGKGEQERNGLKGSFIAMVDLIVEMI